jgi:adenosylmethionine-8-amino-7-oxononanoate aminotransferase
MAAVELVRDRDSRTPFPSNAQMPERVRDAALDRGIIIRASGSNVVICPPLIIDESDLDRLVATIDEAIASL